MGNAKGFPTISSFYAYKDGRPLGEYGPEHIGFQFYGGNIKSIPGGLVQVALQTYDPVALSQGNWYIDAVNGNDANDGATAATALKTHAELSRRVSGQEINPPFVASAGTPIVYVNIMSDLPDSDPLSIEWFLGRDVALYYVGRVAETLATGTLTAVTAANPAANTPWAVTDAGLGGGGIPARLGQRFRITQAGARLNAIAWIAKDNGAGSARLSTPLIPCALGTADVFPGFPGANFLGFQSAPVTPQIGDAYAIERLVTVTIGSFKIRGLGNGPNLQSLQLVFGQLEFRRSDGLGENVFSPDGGGDPVELTTWSCKVGPVVDPAAMLFHSIDDYWVIGAILTQIRWYGAKHGGLTCSAEVAQALRYGITAHEHFFFLRDTLVQAQGIRGPQLFISSAAVFDAIDQSENRGGHAVNIGLIIQDLANHAGPPSNGSCFGPVWNNPSAEGASRLWGANNAGLGVAISAGSTMSYRAATLPTVTGAGGDFTLGAATQGRAWDEAGSAYTALRNLTWANLAAAIGAAGFGGNAHNVQRNSHLVDGL